MPTHDSAEWRAERNQRLDQWVGDPAAIAFLLDYFDACEVADDVVDGDKPVTADDVTRMLYELAVNIPSNPFFARHAQTLLPVLATGIGAWSDSVKLERKADDHSLRFAFVMRATYLEIIRTVITITRGREAAEACSMEILEWFGSETFDEYAQKIRAGRVST